MEALLGASHLLASGIQLVGADVVEAGGGEFSDLVAIVADGKASFPLEVLAVHKNGVQTGIQTDILEFAFVGPHIAETGDVAHSLAGEEVAGLACIEVEAEAEAVLEEATLETYVEAAVGFPLDGGVLNIGELESRGLSEELDVFEVGTSGIVVYVVVTALFVACGNLEVVDTFNIEPLFVAHHPSSLNGGEDTPLHAGELDTLLGFLTETRGRFHGSGEVEEVAVLEIVAGIEIVCQVDPRVVGTARREEAERLGDVGHLIVVVVVTRHVAVAIRIGSEAEATEDADAVGLELTVPIYLEVVEEGGLLAKLRAEDVADGTESFDTLRGRTILGHEVLLVVTIDHVAETVAHGQVLVDGIAGIHVDGKLGLLLIVLVVTIAILENPEGVDETRVTEGVGKAIGVVAVGVVLTRVDIVGMAQLKLPVVVHHVVCIGADEGRLNEAQHIGSRDVASAVVLGPTIVAKVVGIANIGDVHARNKVLEQVDVGIEADVESVEVVLLGRGIALAVAEGEVVHSHIVTTFYADLVVLGESIAIEVFLPVGVLVVHIVVEVAGVLVHERRQRCGGLEVINGLGRGTDELSHIVAILVGIHHLGLLGHEFETSEGADVNASYLAMATLGGDAEDTVGTLGTIEGRTIIENLNGFDVFGVNDVEYVIEETIVEGRTVVLHIPHDAIDNDEGLCVGIERTDTIDKHGCTLCGHTATADSADVGVEVVLNIVFNGNGAGFLCNHLGICHNVNTILIESLEVGSVEVGVLICCTLDGNLGSVVLGVAFGNGHVESRDVFGDFDGVSTIVVGQRGIVAVVECLNAYTSERCVGGSIVNVAANLTHSNGGRLGGGSSLARRSLCLCAREDARAREEEQADTSTKCSLHKIIAFILIHNFQIFRVNKMLVTYWFDNDFSDTEGLAITRLLLGKRHRNLKHGEATVARRKTDIVLGEENVLVEHNVGHLVLVNLDVLDSLRS